MSSLDRRAQAASQPGTLQRSRHEGNGAFRLVSLVALGLALGGAPEPSRAAEPSPSAPHTPPAARSQPTAQPPAAPQASPGVGFPTLRSYTSPTHRYRVHLPAGWNLHAPSGPNDPADVRFGVLPAVRGLVQVFEGAVTTDPATWYRAARQRYDATSKAMPAVAGLRFGTLQPTVLGPRKAHSFDFDTVLHDGGVLTTRIIFAPCEGPDGRKDMIELIVTAPGPLFGAQLAALRDLQHRLSFLPAGTSVESTP